MQILYGSFSWPILSFEGEKKGKRSLLALQTVLEPLGFEGLLISWLLERGPCREALREHQLQATRPTLGGFVGYN
jgi:hypothetical protein